MKDKCPSCDHKFGFRGAPVDLPPEGSGLRKPEYYCPECGSRLRRVDARAERLAAIIGFGALLIATTGALWNRLELSVQFERNRLLVFYGLAVVGIGVNLVYGFTRQHYLEQDSSAER